MKGNKNDVIPWIIKGDHDLGTALLTYLHIPEYKDTVTFHCQQAVEKIPEILFDISGYRIQILT